MNGPLASAYSFMSPQSRVASSPGRVTSVGTLGSMRFVLTRDADGFAAATRPFLAARIEFNVIVTVLTSLLDGAWGGASPPPLFGYGVDDDNGRICFAALRTPPWLMLCSDLEREDDAQLVIDRWLAVDPELPGVNSVPRSARAITAAWRLRTGGTAVLGLDEAVHVLDEVTDPPRPAAGELRVAGAEDRELLVRWCRDFCIEAGIPVGQAESLIAGRMRRDGMLIWENGGPVSMLGVSPAVAGAVRIGPVYTPAEFRRRGYAGSAVAAASRRALERGAQRCTLFTDLTNPTSNKIYAEVGYRRTGDWEEWRFEPHAEA
jgi:predicted GNAT family acetyltransferase